MSGCCDGQLFVLAHAHTGTHTHTCSLSLSLSLSLILMCSISHPFLQGYKVEERQLILSEKRLFSVELSELAEKGEIKL